MPLATPEQMRESFEKSRTLDDNPLAAAATDGIIAAAKQPAVRDTTRPRHPDTAINEAQHDLLTDVWDIYQQVEQQGGVIPATALQMHPWPITATGPHNSGLCLPACPLEDEFVPFVQRTFRRDFGDKIGGNYKVTPIWPITILEDFRKQHEQWGGIVVYMGDHLPGQTRSKVAGMFDRVFAALKKIGNAEVQKELEAAIELQRKESFRQSDERISDAEINTRIKHAKESQLLFYKRRYESCNEIAANEKSNQRAIGYQERWIARWLLARKIYSTAPKWLLETRPADYVAKLCIKCGESIKNPKGYACQACNEIHDGVKAFKAFAITKDHVALKRCTREELNAAGLNDVLTGEEERELEAEEKKGKQKAK